MAHKFLSHLIYLILLNEARSFHLVLSTSETICSLSCHTNPECLSYFYKAVKEPPGNCILKSNNGQSSPGHLFNHYSVLRRNPKKIFYQPVSSLNTEDEAFNAGFNYWIVINGTKSFFALQSEPTRFLDAVSNCFLKSGILPMERTDEFIEAVSSLSNDSVTPRFTSLAREFTDVNDVRHLTWNLGLKEWGEDENGTWNPKFQDWPKENYDSYLFLIDPTQKQFIPATRGHITDLHFCQFLGRNLATGKPTTASSIHGNFRSSNAVDGSLGWSFWHSRDDTKHKPDWISVDLELEHKIRVVMWLGSAYWCTKRNKDVQVWAGNQPLASWSFWNDVNFGALKYCGIHPYSTNKSILSGVTCQDTTIGRYVILVNYGWRFSDMPMQIGEIGVFGNPRE